MQWLQLFVRTGTNCVLAPMSPPNLVYPVSFLEELQKLQNALRDREGWIVQLQNALQNAQQAEQRTRDELQSTQAEFYYTQVMYPYTKNTAHEF